MFALSEPRHNSDNNAKTDPGELRDCPANSIRLREVMAWDTPPFSLQPSTFLPSVSHRGFDSSSLSSFSLNSDLAENFTPMCPNFFQFVDIWNFPRLVHAHQPQEAPADSHSLLQTFCTSVAHCDELQIPCVPHQNHT